MSRVRLDPFFLDTPAGRIFLLLRAPPGARECVLFVPPFADEMNRCRRQISETADLLTSRSQAALVVDLFGTGDSEGEFGDATWEAWKENLQSAINWVESIDVEVKSLVAVRLGCALAAEALGDAERRVDKTVMWQPVINGRQHMTQFLRLRVAASMMEEDGKETVEQLKGRLREGEPLEVAGYDLSSDLWQAIEQIDLTAGLHAGLGKLGVFEVGRRGDAGVSVSTQRLVDAAGKSGIDVTTQGISGEPFWSTTEVVTNSPLRDCTVQWLAEAR